MGYTMTDEKIRATWFPDSKKRGPLLPCAEVPYIPPTGQVSVDCKLPDNLIPDDSGDIETATGIARRTHPLDAAGDNGVFAR